MVVVVVLVVVLVLVLELWWIGVLGMEVGVKAERMLGVELLSEVYST